MGRKIIRKKRPSISQCQDIIFNEYYSNTTHTYVYNNILPYIRMCVGTYIYVLNVGTHFKTGDSKQKYTSQSNL